MRRHVTLTTCSGHGCGRDSPCLGALLTRAGMVCDRTRQLLLSSLTNKLCAELHVHLNKQIVMQC
jgi:hypothetical protein